MKNFSVTPGLSRDFEVQYNGSVIGRSVARGIFSGWADISVAGKVYNLQPKNFWRTRYEVVSNGRTVLEIQHRWGSRVRFSIPGKGRFFDLKPRGLFYLGFVLVDDKKAEVLLISGTFKWKIMAVSYEVLAKDIFANNEEELLLLFMAVYYYRRQRRNARRSN